MSHLGISSTLGEAVKASAVLILVVMDVALGPSSLISMETSLSGSLNPCCNGCRTWAFIIMMKQINYSVLILVVMDVALGHWNSHMISKYMEVS